MMRKYTEEQKRRDGWLLSSQGESHRMAAVDLFASFLSVSFIRGNSCPWLMTKWCSFRNNSIMLHRYNCLQVDYYSVFHFIHSVTLYTLLLADRGCGEPSACENLRGHWLASLPADIAGAGWRSGPPWSPVLSQPSPPCALRAGWVYHPPHRAIRGQHGSRDHRCWRKQPKDFSMSKTALPHGLCGRPSVGCEVCASHEHHNHGHGSPGLWRDRVETKSRF